MSYKALVTVGACALAGLAVVGYGRTRRRWRRVSANLDNPFESLFI